MTSELATQRARLLTPEGEIIDLEFGAISADDAALRIPFIQATLRELRRFELFLSDTVAAEMRSRGQVERRSGDVTFELKPEATWIVDDDGALFRVLHQATANNDITENELAEACQQIVVFRFHHGRLTTLAKRVPEINSHRRRVEGDARLRIKAK